MGEQLNPTTYTWIVGLQERNLDTFILEVPLRLRKVEWGVVRRSMPVILSAEPLQPYCQPVPVRQERDLVGRHLGSVARFCRWS